MATLTEVSGIARNTIKFGLIGIVILSIIPFIWAFAKQTYLRLNPPPPPPPTVRYGKLPKLFRDPPAAGVSYKLETIEGSLPNLSNVAKAYVIGINKSRLVSLDRYREKAKVLGFTNQPIQLNEVEYKFEHTLIPATLKVNVVSDRMAFSFDWTNEPSIYELNNVPLGNQAIGEVRSLMQNLGVLESDLATGQAKFTYLVATGSAMVPTTSIRDANFVKVDLFRADKDKMRIMTTGGDASPVYAILSPLAGNKRLTQMGYQYSRVLDDDFATYPLKGVQEAWTELSSGTSGFVAKPVGENVTVRKVSLGYYEANEPQNFLQPIYVFEGDGGFIAYVQAVRSDFVE